MEQRNVKIEVSRYEILDPDITQSLSRVKKSTAGKRKIQHEWKGEEAVRLIAAVRVRPPLWNAHRGEYKYSRQEYWREVLDELNIEGIDLREVKTKWLALRGTFKANLAKLRDKGSGQGSPTVTWRHFKQMQFLERNKLDQTTESESSMEMTSAVTDSSILDKLPDSSNVEMSQQSKRQRMQPTPAPCCGSSIPHVSSALSNTVVALQTSDPNSSFCDHLLAELRTLSETKSRRLRKLLMQMMHTFMDLSEADVKNNTGA